ncbi:MAG: hypothetical protein V7731_16130 [Amphritea sp.]
MKQTKLARRALAVISRVYDPTEKEQERECRFDENDADSAELDLLYAHMESMDAESKARAKKTVASILSGERRYLEGAA